MKRLHYFVIALLCLMPFGVRAQYYQIANQIPQLISPALSGSLNYKGFVELSGMAGLGHNRANVISVSTTQGFRYASWFFMGVGAGVDVVMAQQPAGWQPSPGYDYMYRGNAKTKAMVPLFSDFRFTFGPASSAFFLDIKLGAAWMIGRDYLRMADGFMSNQTQFYLRPTIGVRIPVSASRQNQAFNVGVTYQLLTSNNNYYWNDNSLTLNNIGVSLSYEW
ncbi:MAG: hypothetical protein NC127_09590 [Muribaculum sp.]|nr:hypothetical protein [Muribaculum sp.]